MANDERQTDTFIREVDEELRRDQLKALWNRFGWLFIGVCVLIVLITAGNRGWVWWQERKAAQAGDRFLAAVEEIQSGNRDAGEAELKAIAEKGGAGYAALARLQLAGESVATGDKKGALSTYDTLTADTSLPQSLRDLARVKAALLALDLGDDAGAVQRVEPLNEAGNPWRHAAREVLGTAAYASGDLAKAREYFTAIQEDAETPQDMWLRSGLMISLIDGQLAAPETASKDAAPAGDSTDNASKDTMAPADGNGAASTDP